MGTLLLDYGVCYHCPSWPAEPLTYFECLLDRFIHPQIVQCAPLCLSFSICTLSFWAWEVHYQSPLPLLVGLRYQPGFTCSGSAGFSCSAKQKGCRADRNFSISTYSKFPILSRRSHWDCREALSDQVARWLGVPPFFFSFLVSPQRQKGGNQSKWVPHHCLVICDRCWLRTLICPDLGSHPPVEVFPVVLYLHNVGICLQLWWSPSTLPHSGWCHRLHPECGGKDSTPPCASSFISSSLSLGWSSTLLWCQPSSCMVRWNVVLWGSSLSKLQHIDMRPASSTSNLEILPSAATLYLSI